MNQDIGIHDDQESCFARRTAVDELIPCILFALLGKIFDSTRKGAAMRVREGLLLENLRGDLRRAIGATINHADYFTAQASVLQFCKKRLLEKRTQGIGDGLLLIPSDDANRDQHRRFRFRWRNMRLGQQVFISAALLFGFYSLLHGRSLGDGIFVAEVGESLRNVGNLPHFTGWPHFLGLRA